MLRDSASWRTIVSVKSVHFTPSKKFVCSLHVSIQEKMLWLGSKEQKRGIISVSCYTLQMILCQTKDASFSDYLDFIQNSRRLCSEDPVLHEIFVIKKWMIDLVIADNNFLFCRNKIAICFSNLFLKVFKIPLLLKGMKVGTWQCYSRSVCSAATT